MGRFMKAVLQSSALRFLPLLLGWLLGMCFVVYGTDPLPSMRAAHSAEENSMALSVVAVSAALTLLLLRNIFLQKVKRKYLLSVAAIGGQLLLLTYVFAMLGYNDPGSHRYAATVLAVMESLAVWKLYSGSTRWTRAIRLGRESLMAAWNRNAVYISTFLGLAGIPLAVILAKNAWLPVWCAYVTVAAAGIWLLLSRGQRDRDRGDGRFNLPFHVRLFLKAMLWVSGAVWLTIFGLAVYYFSPPELIQVDHGGYLQASHFGANSNNTGYRLTFIANKFDENTQALSGDAQLCIDQSMFALAGPTAMVLYVNPSNGPDSTASVVNKFDASDLTGISNCTNSGRQYTVKDVEVHGIRNGAQLYYPSDHYAFALYAKLQARDGSLVAPDLAVDTSNIAGMQYRQAGLGWWNGNSERKFTLSRQPSLALFSYVITLAPMAVLAIIASHVLFGVKMSRKADSYVFGIGLVVLTILPLRSVLVPGSIGGFTSIDLLLGLELATAAFLMVLYYVRGQSEKAG